MSRRRDVLRSGARLALAALVWPVARARAADAPAGADANLPRDLRQALESASLVYVATRRRSGERSTIAPIWFHWDGGELFFTTSPTSWKARRLRRGSPLYLWVGSEDGPFAVGEATPVVDAETVARLGEAYSRKYWIAWLGFFRPRPDRVADGRTVAYRVRLATGTPPPSPRS